MMGIDDGDNDDDDGDKLLDIVDYIVESTF